MIFTHNTASIRISHLEPQRHPSHAGIGDFAYTFFG